MSDETGEAFRITGIEGDTIHLVSFGEHVPRSRWWMLRLWVAKRICRLGYLMWPKDDPDE